MERNDRYCVIMAGGLGNSMWPLSRESKPKQFTVLSKDGQTQLRKAFLRNREIVPEGNILVITTERYANLVREDIPELREENLLIEPFAKKTGACIAYSTYEILRRNPEAVVVVTPSDIIIHDGERYRTQVEEALRYVQDNDVLMTLGVLPTRPDTTFGYIQVTGGREAILRNEPLKVKTFTEKPPAEVAGFMCMSGEFLWNSGIFTWKCSVIKAEMERHMPQVTSPFANWREALGGPARVEFLRRAYADVDAVSIDIGVLEKTDKAWVQKADFDWCDLSSLITLDRYFLGKGNHRNYTNLPYACIQDSRDCSIIALDKGKLVAVKGLEGYMVVDTGDVLMICPKDEEKHKELLAGLTGGDFDKFL